jgi:hypothetical protein
MKKSIIYITVLSTVFILAADVFAASSRKRYFSKPQIGLWYGPVTPMLDTAEHVDSDLGGGAFFRYNLPFEPLKLGIDTSYQYHGSEGVAELRLIPVYFNLLYLLPIDLPIRIQLKGGAGLCNVYMEPDETSQWDPMFMGGAEISFPAGKMANIALRIDYLCMYEEYLDGANKNGHVVNAGVSLYFNLNL